MHELQRVSLRPQLICTWRRFSQQPFCSLINHR